MHAPIRLHNLRKDTVINDTVNGVPLLIFHDKDSSATAVFKRTVDDRIETFAPKADYFVQDRMGNAVESHYRGGNIGEKTAVNV